MELVGVNCTETSVTGLTPGVYYTFSVTAKNAVSSQDNNINARSVRATANTEEGGTIQTTSLWHCITKHGSTWYIGMAQVPRHRFHTFEKSQYHFQFQ